ncbi:MAG TPA: helix-turn-helix domain-containing protein [Pseudonocardia sp.]
MATSKLLESSCSIARSVGVLGERWTFLILREAFMGASRFGEFRERLGIAPDVLSTRLATLVEFGVMTREPYRDPGGRGRDAYLLTDMGRELDVLLGALQQWGDRHLPWAAGPTIERVAADTGLAVHVGYLDEQGREVEVENVRVVRTAAYPR